MNRTKALLFLTITFAPLYIIRFEGFSLPTTLLEILILSTIFVWFVDNISFQREKRVEFVKSSSLSILIAVFIISLIISVFVSPDKLKALGIFKAYFIEPIIIFFIVKNVIKTDRDLNFLLRGLFLSGFWLAILALIQGFTGKLIFAPHEALAGRAHGVYNSANSLGLYLGPIIALSISDFLQTALSKAKLGIKFLKLLFVVTLVSAVVLSRSTGALVGITAVFLSFLLSGVYHSLPYIRRLIKAAVYSLSVLMLVFFIFFFVNISLYAPKVSNPQIRETQDTLKIRLCLWEGTKGLLKDNIFLGAGLSGFKELYSDRYYTCDRESLEYPHNVILNFWTEAGMLGLISFMLLVVYYLQESFRLMGAGYWIVSAGFLSAVVYSFVHGLVDVPYFKNDLSLQFWIIYAFLVKSKKILKIHR